MASEDPVEVKDFRAALKAAQIALEDALYTFEVALEALREAKRLEDDTTAEETALAAAEAGLNAAREEEASAFTALQAALEGWLAPGTSGDATAAETDIARFEAKVPIVLFPVRIETRFDGGLLKIRLSPDELFLDTHEIPVTREEDEAGRKYWESYIAGADERPLWRDMFARFGVARAAYVVSVARPGNPDGSEGGPYWPELRRKASSWTRPGTATLPDRFVAYVYKNGARRGPYYGGRVVEPLQQTPDPKLREGDLVELAPGHPIDPRIEWNFNFERDTGRAFENALKVGMGIVVPLEGDDAVTGFDRVIVLGVKSSMGSANTSLALRALVDAHHYTNGFEFMRQGTATNNVEGRPTSYPLEENAGDVSFAVERMPPGVSSGSDGSKFVDLLDLTNDEIRTIRRQESFEIEQARAMNRVLWPATFGYYMRYLLASPDTTTSVFSKDEIAWAREYFSSYVLARGVAPAFRVGSVPYGVLPVAALGSFRPRSFRTGTPPPAVTQMESVEAALLNPLRTLFGFWKDAAAGVRRIQPGAANPDVDVAEVLATQPSAKEFRVRWGIGKDVQGLHHAIFGWEISAFLLGLEQQASDSFAAIGGSNWRTRLGYMLFDQKTSNYTGEIVAPPPLSETEPLASNFIAGIRTADIATLNADAVSGKPASENLLYAVLRHSTLMAYLLGYDANIATLPDWEYFFIPSLLGPPATLDQIVGASPPIDLGALPGVAQHWQALQRLETLPTAELERLFTESLDLTSHRLDPWVTAFAKRRIDEMRLGHTGRHDHFGAYGWLEDVRPGERPVVNVPGLGDVPAQHRSGGFVHAPSMTQASAAAVLRSGHLSVRGENGTQGTSAYAIDLSSRRVRLGRRLFEGVRNGQPIGALLGYEIERRLHDSLGLDEARFALRALYPLVANQSGQDGGVAPETIAARSVVDGARLLAERSTIPWGSGALPAVGTDQQQGILAELDRLAEAYDAAADLLAAEGVYQLVRGNIDAAVPALNNIVEGAQPPDTVVSRSTRGGVGISHRVALVFPSDALPTLPSGVWSEATPRALTEPILDAWLGGIIGDPAGFRAELRYLDEAGNVIPSTPPGGAASEAVTVSLDELDLHPLDLLALAQVIAQKNQGSILDFRIITVALEDPARRPDAPPSRFELKYDVTDSRSFLDLMEVLNATARLLADARPLKTEDLVTPGDTEGELDAPPQIPDVAAQEFYARTEPLRGRLAATVAALDYALRASSGYRLALRAAALFDPHSAFPDPGTPDEELRASVQTWYDRLQAKSSSLPLPLTPAELEELPGSSITAAALEVFQAVLGDTVLAIPPLGLPRSKEIERSLRARSTLLAGRDSAPDKYLQQVQRTRDKLRQLRKVSLYARTAGMPRPRVDVIQLPHQPGDRWLGLPFETPPEESRSAVLVLNYASELHANGVTWSGLFIDGWTEVVPNQAEDTGVAFNYEGPRARAPHAVLVAAPSGESANWVWSELLDAVEQTFDLAQIRGVDRDLLGIGQLIPAAVFTTNENPDNTVSTVLGAIAQPPPDAQGLER